MATMFADLFTPRQLVALTTFSDLVGEARKKVLQDARAAVTLDDDERPLTDGGSGPDAYADAVATYLALGLSRLADASTTFVRWKPSMDQAIATFARQALPMVWDYAESNTFAHAAGDLETSLKTLSKVLERASGVGTAHVVQRDSVASTARPGRVMMCTDPPYYDNIGYADLSDFFYIWLRRSLGTVYPRLFSTLLTPKVQELIATPYRHDGSKAKAKTFFEQGLGSAFDSMRETQVHGFPLTVYYAFKQAEMKEARDSDGNLVSALTSTGWETMLAGLVNADFSIRGTWPLRTELSNRMLGAGTNALASSVVLACRPRPVDAPLATRREFLAELHRELPEALRMLQQGSIAPVDLAQASIGPGMAVFTKYAKVVEADGSPMTVRTALALINQTLDAVLSEQESEFDADTRWALSWFEQHAHAEGPFGDAETLCKAKNVSVDGLAEAGILSSGAGKVRLLRREDLDPDWDPATDKRLTVWEIAQHLIHVLEDEGERPAAALLRRVGSLGETARDLAYRLYVVCERKKWAQEALSYNSLVVAWPQIRKLGMGAEGEGYERPGLFE